MRMADGTYRELIVLYQGQHGTHKCAYWSHGDAINDMMAQTAAGEQIQSVYRREPQIFTREQYPELYPATETLRPDRKEPFLPRTRFA